MNFTFGQKSIYNVSVVNIGMKMEFITTLECLILSKKILVEFHIPKYGFCSVSLGHFIKHKPHNSEECSGSWQLFFFSIDGEL